MLTTAGFKNVTVSALPPDQNAKGPALFVASAEKA
jgi:hypothetical protein